MASNSDAKKAVYNAVYNAAMAGKPISQGAANKIYDKVVGTAKKTTVPTNAAYNQINARTGKNLLGNNADLDILAGQTAATNSPPVSTTKSEKTNQQKYEEAKTAYDSYMESEEYQQKLRDAMKPYLLGNGATASTTPYGAMATAEAQKKEQAQKEESKDAKKEELGALAAYYKQQMEAEEDRQAMDAAMKELESWSEEDIKNLDRFIVERDMQTATMMNPYRGTKYATYLLNPIIEKYGYEKVWKLAEAKQRMNNAQTMEETIASASALANNRPVAGGIVGSAVSVPAKQAGAMAAPIMYALEAGQRTDQFHTLDPNNPGNIPSVYAETVREEVAQNIRGDEEANNKLRDLAANAYQGGMSAVDSLARLALSGGNPAVSSVIAASDAFGSGLRKYSQQGADPTRAATMAIADAGLEYITEKIPTDEMLSMFKAGDKTGAVRNILKQAFLVEPTEEEVSLFSGVAAETVILADKSSNKLRMGELIANGMSYEEARAQIYKELWKEAAQTYAVSVFGGGFGAATATLAGAAVNSNHREETEQQAAAAPFEQTEKTPEQLLVEMTAADLAQNAPAPAPAKPLTENQRHLENGIAATMGVPVQNNEQQNTNAVTNPIESYPADKQNVIRSFLNSVDQGIKNFVERVKGGDKTFERHKISDVSSRAAKDIGGLLNIDANGYTHNINTNGVLHILNRHGSNGEHDQTMSLGDDIARVGWVLENYDSVEPVIENGKQVYSTEFMGKENSPAPLVKFTKKIDGTYYAVEAACENKYKKLWVQSAYLQKNGDITQAPAESQSANRETHAQSELASPSPNNIVADGEAEVKGIGAAEENFSGKAQYQDLLYEGNVQPDRATDVRPMEVPKTDSYGRNVSEFVANAYGAKVTSDRMANEIEMLVQEGALGFDKRSNQDALNDAAAEIETKGAATIRNQITRNVANGRIKDGDIEKAMLLYASYANKNGARAQADAAEIMVDLTTMAHMTGRNLQLFKLLRKLTPEGQLMAIKQNVQRNVENMKRAGLVKKDFEADIDNDLVNEYKAAAAENARAVTDEQKQQSEQKMRKLQEAIYAKAAAEMPATFKAKWDAWRYMAMLCNAKTQVRNFGGNAAMIPYKEVKDRMAALFEKAFVSKDKRTKSLLTDPKLVAWAKEDLKTEDVQNALKYSAKIGDDATNAKFSEGKKVFDNKVLETVRKFSEKVPQAGDMLFKNGYYARSYADFLRARGYSAEDVQNGKVSEAVLNEGRSYAVEEAMKATFNDSNAFSDMISSMRFKEADNVWKKAANIAGEGVLPFRRTPANITVRFAEYSPAGLAKGVWDMATKVRNGDLSAAAALDEIAAGVTGSAAMALGYFLAKGIAGVKLTGGKVDEDEERQGHQKYAIEFMIDGKEYSYKIDWAAPANMPLFVGANIYDMLENAGQDTDVSFITSFIHGMGTMFEPILALSCMSPLNELVEGVRYAGEGEAIYSIAVDLATSYFMQGIPALLRQTYTAMQENKQTTFANSDDPTIRDLQNLGAQIPFVAKNFQTDKRNAWGETQDMGNAATRAANAYLNPGTFKRIENDAVEQELARLKEAQTENVSPPAAKKTVNYTDKNGETHNNERLTEEQYQTLAETQGKTAKEMLDKMVASSDYQALTDAQKASAIDAVYAYAAEQGKVAALPDYKSNADTWIKEAGKDPVGTVIRKFTGKAFDDAMKSMTASWTDKLDAAESVEALEAAYAVYSNMSQATRKAVKDDATGRVAAYMEARNNRIKTETFVDLYKTYWELDKSGKKASEKAQQWAYTLERAHESGKLTEKQKTVMQDALGFGQYLQVEATKFNEMTDAGLTAKAAQDTVKAINNLLPEEGYAQVRDIQNWDAIAAMTISDTDKIAAMRTYMTDKQEEKLDEVLGMGYSVDEYPEIWRIIDGYTSGTGKKARTIAHLQSEYGINYASAKKLYEVFK